MKYSQLTSAIQLFRVQLSQNDLRGSNVIKTYHNIRTKINVAVFNLKISQLQKDECMRLLDLVRVDYHRKFQGF